MTTQAARAGCPAPSGGKGSYLPGLRTTSALLVAAAMLGCGGSSAPGDVVPPPGLPVITSFTAAPPAIYAGGASTLSWSVTGDATLSLQPGIGAITTASVGVAPAATTTYVLTASNAAGSVSASTTVTVNVLQAPVASVTVTLGATSLQVGQTTPASAVLRDRSGNLLAGRPVAWASSNTSVATVGASGLVTAVAAGASTITATSEGQTGNAVLTVTTVPVAAVVVSLGSPVLDIGQATTATATLLDADGNFLTGRPVTWSTSDASIATVTAGGVVTAVGAGTADVSARCEGRTGLAAVTVIGPGAGAPARMDLVSAPRQTTGPGQAVLQPPAVRVLDAGGTPVPGVSVSFAVTTGGGTVTGSPATTDASGVARAASWVLGAAGTQSVRATTPAIAGAVVDFAGLARTPGAGFDITLRLDPSMSDAQVRAFVNAKERIEEIIVGDLPAVTLNHTAAELATCGGQAVSETIDDVLVFAEVVPMDGIGGILARAGPCYVRASSHLPVLGHMQFDSADVAQLEAAGHLDSVILHEMLHVVGFGIVWSDLSLLIGSGTDDPYFVGSGAKVAFQAFNDGGSYLGNPVPVENTGGAATVNAHWRETVFKTELMTGFLSGTTQPFSRTTAASLSDLGYVVDLARADPFSILSSPLAASAATEADRPEPSLKDDVRLAPPIAVDDTGEPVAR
jgi:hypothetical protein